MADLDDLLDPWNGKRGPRCTTGIALAALTAGDQAKIRAALADERVTGSNITRWLVGKGQQVNVQSVRRHRNGECFCDR